MKKKPWDNYEDGLGAFHIGQHVIAIAAMEGSAFKNGQPYVCAEFVWKSSTNPIANGKFFWYIGIVGHANGGAYFHPGIFAPIQSQFIEISFSEVREIEKVITNAN